MVIPFGHAVWSGKTAGFGCAGAESEFVDGILQPPFSAYTNRSPPPSNEESEGILYQFPPLSFSSFGLHWVVVDTKSCGPVQVDAGGLAGSGFCWPPSILLTSPSPAPTYCQGGDAVTAVGEFRLLLGWFSFLSLFSFSFWFVPSIFSPRSCCFPACRGGGVLGCTL